VAERRNPEDVVAQRLQPWFDFSRDGIEHVHLPDFLLDDNE